MRWFEGNVTQIEIDSHPNGYILYERINKSTNQWANLLLIKKLERMKSFTDGSSPPQVHRSAASDPEPAYRQRAIEWWAKNIQNTISGLGEGFVTWRKVCLRIRLIRPNKLFGDWKMARRSASGYAGCFGCGLANVTWCHPGRWPTKSYVGTGIFR